MKCWLMGMILGVLCIGAWADDAYRDFTNSEGKSFRGKVLSFDVRKGVVQIEAENRKRARIPLTALSDKDQEYVKAWDSAQDFLSESLFKISLKCSKEDNKGKSMDSYEKEIDAENVVYEISLENKSPKDLENIKIEYCVFYEQEVGRGSSEESRKGTCYDSIDIKTMASRTERVLNTKTVIIYKEQMNSDFIWSSGSDNVQKGEVHGIWVRASKALPSGERVMREYCLPDNLPNSKNWTTRNVAVGMKK